MTKTPRQRTRVKSRKPRSTTLKRSNLRKVKISNSRAQGKWDTSATVRQNYSRLGLTKDANATESQKESLSAVVPEEHKDRMDLEIKGEEVHTVKHQPPGEREACGALVAKHGLNVKKMTRDLKLNPQQHTAKQLLRKLRVFFSRDEAMLARLESENEHIHDE
eukprot:ANDGO_04236.mRNA.1 Nucleolar protein 16